ncbi:diaminopimelate epimerase [Cellulomonas marina]|uniref:Diaminopimelate epimerase n=1 Tax=Cellulomonas marina TaxID=988821 RepID=A0A1I0VIJ0_9CELL|nr:diaminopimelate epimerase [Cellulomonas marina]GIG27936.1 diaminopimelate epimerase [Cellulomonas marina]SFA76309.1 diaminopimelate epimerase [Cellulomonas marina]
MTTTAAPAHARTLHVHKGHGTQNDFVLLDGREPGTELDAPLVRALADRRSGLGGDGVIRLVASEALPEGRALLADDPRATQFMDYRNADGSVAEMCGNGVRVTALLARRLGLWDPTTGDLVLGTRAGVRVVRHEPAPGVRADGTPEPDWYAVDMGPWRLPGGTGGGDGDRPGAGPAAAPAGLPDARSSVTVPGLPPGLPGLDVDLGNPHTVVVLPDEGALVAADLTAVPLVEPAPPAGTNVELVLPTGEETGADGRLVGRARMRVHERGVGETRSCGTGACAAALAVRVWAGAGAPDTWFVDVPGGTVRVRVLAGGHVELAGPAVLVADAVLDRDALLA